MKDQLIPLNSTGIYILELPKESEKHGLIKNVMPYDILEYLGKNDVIEIKLPHGDWQILGTITSDSISFDPAPYLDFVWHKRNKLYLDYRKDPREWLNSPTASFRSLLSSCGYYWVNPLIEPDKFDYSFVECEAMKGFISTKGGIDYNKLLQEWQSFEDNLVKGILLALIKK